MSWEIGLGIYTLPWIKWVLTGTQHRERYPTLCDDEDRMHVYL